MSVNNSRGEIFCFEFCSTTRDACEINGIILVSSESKRSTAAVKHTSSAQKRLTVLDRAHRILYSTKSSTYFGSRRRPVIYIRIVFRLVLPFSLACFCSAPYSYPRVQRRNFRAISDFSARANSTAHPANDSPSRCAEPLASLISTSSAPPTPETFRASFQADPKFAVARLNLGIALQNRKS